MRYQTDFYPKENLWEISADENSLFEYSIQDVLLPIVEFFAKKKKKLDKPIDDLEPQEQDEILNWFENEVFGTEEFGKQMIQWLKSIVNQIESEEDLESVFKDTEQSITVDERSIEILEKLETEKVEKERKKIETLFTNLPEEDAKSLFNGIQKKESWTEKYMKRYGVSIYDQEQVKLLIYPGYYRSLSSRVIGDRFESAGYLGYSSQAVQDKDGQRTPGYYVSVVDYGNSFYVEWGDDRGELGHLETRDPKEAGEKFEEMTKRFECVIDKEFNEQAEWDKLEHEDTDEDTEIEPISETDLEELPDIEEYPGPAGGPLGLGGTDKCVCPKCGYEEKHEKGIPCSRYICPSCANDRGDEVTLVGKDMPHGEGKGASKKTAQDLDYSTWSPEQLETKLQEYKKTKEFMLSGQVDPWILEQIRMIEKHLKTQEDNKEKESSKKITKEIYRRL